MKTYELTYIISPETTSEEAEAKAKELEANIQSKEGVVLRQTNPAARTLSYPVNKHASGFFGTMDFQLEPEKLVEFKESVAKDGKIVRHMVIIKQAAELKKERRTRGVAKAKPAPTFEVEKKSEVVANEDKPSFTKASDGKEKVELKDIEQKLDELLND